MPNPDIEMYAEVILPLPLYSKFTYSIPPDLQGDLQPGVRVLVQFGAKKYYTGIVSAVTPQRPGDYDVKPIMALLDNAPVLRPPQLKHWEWIADYYLCSVGDVYRAAVPTGLKPESETWISINPDFEAPEDFHLTEKQKSVLQCIEGEKRVRLSEIESNLKIKGVAGVVSQLLALGVVEIAETVTERYRPKTERMIRLCAEKGDSERLHQCFDLVKRSAQQERLLLSWMDHARWLAPPGQQTEVSRDELLKATGVSSAILRAMITKGIFEEYKRTTNRFALDLNTLSKLSPLSDIQKKAMQEVKASMKDHAVTLLHGVTGSGKTEIYTHLMDQVLRDGNQVLYLVPEISLTTQLTDRLRKVFGDRLLVYHSKYSDNERVDIWKRVLTSNEPLIVIGARSSVFLPFAHLGLVIVDEEHEPSFKQYDPAPRYNARDAAIVLATMHGAKTLLGSATPSVETYYKATQGKYGLVTLNSRYEEAQLPQVEIVDMREQRKRRANKGILSEPLMLATKEALEHRRQTILFQNRRGFAPVVICKTCGWTPKCPNCDVSPVYHKHTDILKCHYCGLASQLPTLCPACGENSIEVFGYGTQRVAEDVQNVFPKVAISRMDLDTTRNKNSYQNIIEEFSEHKTDILVGTQMVTKGLDFGDVNVVGIVSADTMLNFPDFRSNERAFNMMEQVAGRAGRRKEQGKVVIQTSSPDNPILSYVKRHDFKGYYEEEIKARRQFAYPPFTKIIHVYLKSKDQSAVDAAAVLYAKALGEVFGQRVLGPERPFVGRVATYYLQQIMLKIESGASMVKVKHILRQVYESLARDKLVKACTVYYDVDPV